MNILNQSLKIIAIRPLHDCSTKYRRTLEPGTLYPLHQNYKFYTDEHGGTKIEADRQVDALYNQTNDTTNGIALSVSAIVGENGSGKSSLVELLYLAIYVLSVKMELLTIDQDRFRNRVDSEYADILEEFKLEVFYEMDQKFYCMRFDNSDLNETKGNIRTYNIFMGDFPPIENLFYSIVINYSLYGLNERSSGYWLSSLFHKNDGYRTPLVINPFRDWGRIDVLSEAHLAQSRLLANLKPSQKETVNILTNRAIQYVKLDTSLDRAHWLDKVPIRDIIRGLTEELELEEDEIFNEIYRTVLNVKVLPEQPEKIKYRRLLERYVIKKVVKICRNYREYRDNFYKEENKLPSIKNFPEYLKALAKDPSHITLKLRQALNTYRENMFRLDEENGVVSHDGGLIFPILELSKRIANAYATFPDRELVEFIPAAALRPTVVMDDGSNFISLSSGEQQFVHSMQAVLYHLNNLNSAFAARDGRVTYNHVNVVLDEIELYFHPEFQRRYVYELIGNVREMDIPNIRSINIIFLTHSPFILSDIPKENILKLQRGKVIPQTNNTFAGNIHTMLADSFFMESTIGEFAKQQVLAIVEFYEKVRRAESNELIYLSEVYYFKRPIFKFLLKNIGEDVLIGAMRNHVAYMDERLGYQQQALTPERKRLLQMKDKIDEELRKLDDDQN